jgi:hypothetical protein
VKKSELKEVIKECVREVMFEDGMLSSLIKEVATGLGSTVLTAGQSTTTAPQKQDAANNNSEVRSKVIEALGLEKNQVQFDSPLLKNPKLGHLFEGTTPVQAESPKGAASFSTLAPGDSGVSLNSIPGAGSWGKVANRSGNN